jgi:hypothetical protein
MKKVLGSFFIALGVVLASWIGYQAVIDRHDFENVIWVKGLGKKDFTSDLIVWSGSFSTGNMDLQAAYRKLDTDRQLLKNYLNEHQLTETEYVFDAVNIERNYEYHYDEHGRSSRIFQGYRLSQEVKIESGEVEKIEKLSRQVTDLINKGLEFYSSQPQYFYTGLSDLKLQMISEATADARMRAEKIATESGSKLGDLKNARMGVFQIIAQNSNEDFSWGGAYNTHSKEKTATITMSLEFEID